MRCGTQGTARITGRRDRRRSREARRGAERKRGADAKARGEVGFPVGRIAFQDATPVAGRRDETRKRRGARRGVGLPSERLPSGGLVMRG
jgi:hypothetical protein